MRTLYFHPVVSSSVFLLSSPHLSRLRLDVYHTSHMMWLSANLECRSETRSTRLAENTGCKKSPKIRHLGSIAQLYPAISSQLRHLSTIGKKLLNSNISSTCPHTMVNFGPLTAEMLASLGHPSKFQPVSRLGFVTARTLLNGGQQNFAGCLAISWTATLYIQFWGLLSHNGILPGAIFTLRPSRAFSCIGSVTARHSTHGHQPNFVAWCKDWNYGTFAERTNYIRLGSCHVGHRPTF